MISLGSGSTWVRGGNTCDCFDEYIERLPQVGLNLNFPLISHPQQSRLYLFCRQWFGPPTPTFTGDLFGDTLQIQVTTISTTPAITEFCSLLVDEGKVDEEH